MTSENPWHGLSPGGTDARRVDAKGRWDFFWWVSEKMAPGLIFRLPPDVAEIQPLPKIRSLDIGYRSLPSGRALVIALREAEQAELFATFCADLVAAADPALAANDALTRLIRRTLRWHHLLRGGKPDGLSLEEQRGLVGELRQLEILCDLVGERAAIEAWKGPHGSPKDFELQNLLIEVKARRGAAKPHVQISSEDQLADVPGARLFLGVFDVDAAVKPAGMTLTDHVHALEQRFSEGDLEAYGMWEAALEAVGFSFEHDYSARRWTVGQQRLYEVAQGFPRIEVPLTAGVGSVSYSVALEACEPHRVSAADVEKVIGGQ